MQLRYLVLCFVLTCLVLSGNAQTPVSGTKTICPSGCDFNTLKRAFDTISTNGLGGAVILELGPTYTSTGETFPLSPPTNASTTNTITIRPAAAVSSALSIISTNATATLILNGAKNVTFDGRNGGSGSNQYLTISNSNTGNDAPAIVFQNDATANTVKYCTIQSRNINPAEGTVFFTTTSGTTGNDSNLIDRCTINDLSTTLPVNAIYSRGTAGKENSENTISNCQISNFYRNAVLTATAIFVDTGSTRWNITDNKIFQTATRDPSNVLTMRCIYVADGDGHIISGNIIGYNSASGTGTFTLGSPSLFRGISVSVGTTTATSIQNNTIAGIAQTSNQSGTADGASPFIGIEVIQGLAHIGNQTKNTIGSQSSTNITLALSGTTTNASPACAIYIGGSSNDSIQNNEIGGISQITTGNRRVSVIGIRNNSSGVSYIGNNKIGGNTPNSIQNIATLSQVVGILSSTGSVTIQNNTIRNITHAGPNVGTDGSVSAIGINLNNTTTANQTISGNTIEKIANTNIGNGAYAAIGIRFNGPSSGTNLIEKNTVRRISLSAAGTTGYTEGIRLVAGTTSIINNSISLGTNTTGGTITKPVIIRGIYELAGTNTFYHNSVLVSGSSVLNNVSSYAFISSNTAGTRLLRNNSFVNTRSFQTDNTAVGNYTFAVDGTLTGGAITGLTSNYNLFYSSGTGGYVARNPITAGANYTTLAAWTGVATTYEANSVSGDPLYNSVDLLKPLAGTALVAGDGTVSVTTDVEGVVRSLPRMGAYELTGDYEGPRFTHTALLKTVSTTDRSLSAQIVDITGVKSSGGLSPRIYYFKNSGAVQSASGTLTSGNTLSGTWSFTLSASAMGGLATGDTVSYYLVAQDSVGSPLVTSNPEGVSATNVNSVVSAPPTFNKYLIVSPSNNFYTICDTCDFQSLTESGSGGLFEALNSSVLTSNATVYIYQATDETGVRSLTGDALGGYRLRIVPAVDSVITISNSTNLSQAMIRFDGVSNLTIDGSFNNSGRRLRFINTNTTASGCFPVISFDNTSTNDSLLSCIIESNATNAARYPVVIGQAGTQKDIVIAKNLIRGSVGTPGTIGSTIGGVLCNSVSNKKITVGGSSSSEGNEITDFLTNGVYFQATGDSITISNNKIYRSMDRNAATNAIFISGGVRHRISYNSIGGNSTDRSGAPFTIRGAFTLNAISANLGNTDSSFINNNSIGNFGSANDVDATVVNGISASGGLIRISNNTVGGGASLFDTIRTTSTGVGILLGGTGTYYVENNTIGNWSHYRSSADALYGIQVSNANTNFTLINNTIRNLTGFSNTTSTASHPIGIYISASSTGTNTINQNTIHTIRNNQTVADARVAGMRITNTTGTTNIERNRIYGLSLPNTTVNHTLWGILVTGSTNTNIGNNMLSIAPTNGTCAITGIAIQPTAGTHTVFYNNVYIGGSTASGSIKSYAFNRNTNSPTTTVRNNIFYNERTGGTGGHFAMGVNNSTALTLSHNALVTANASNTAEFGTTAYSFSGFNTASGQTSSRNGINSIYPSNTFFSNTATADLTSADCLTSNGGTPVSITVDYNNNTRSGSIPDIGANEFATIQNTWTGNISTDFSIGSNWCSSSAPGVNDTFTIANTVNKPQLSANTTIHTVSILSGARLDLNGYLLSLTGTVSGSGVIRGSSTSSLTIGGTSGSAGTVLIDQTTPGTTNRLSTLTLNRGSSPASGSVTLSGATQIIDSVVLLNGTLNTGGSLTLLSSASKTARIPQINTSNAAISGNITVQRYIESAGRRWRFLGAPVSGTTIEDWRSEIHITGPGTGNTVGTTNSNGFDASLSNQPSVYWYDESITGGSGNGWTAPSNTSASIPTGRGYRVFIRGPRSDGNGLLDGSISTQNPVTMDVTGTPITGNVNMPVFYTASGGASADGWCLLSNPYASPISWNSIYDDVTARTNINPTAYVLDAITLNGYVSYNAASDIGTLTNGIIPSGCGFYIQTNASSPSLTIKETHKSSGNPGSYHKQSTDPFSIRFYGQSSEADIFLFKPMQEASPFFDSYDILKLSNPNLNLSSYGADLVKLSADCRPLEKDTEIIILSVQSSKTGLFNFDINGLEAIPPRYETRLVDTYTQHSVVLSNHQKIPFTITDDSNSVGKRFYLQFTEKPKTGLTGVAAPKPLVHCFPTPFNESLTITYANFTASQVVLRLLDVTGKTILSSNHEVQMEGQITLSTVDLNAGIYFLVVDGGGTQPLVYKVVK